MKKLYVMGTSAVVTALALPAASFAAADTTLSAQTDTVKSYFQDNIGIVIGLFVAVALLLWLLGMAFRSVGAKKPSKVG